ncbi:MAG TPA: indolepyruvate oxidoreductase subunit beta [Paludibacteraceae bacterium]|nr:indolepyruvate oxidoreductase subunit beta [Paludibacteraceae bacterium]HPL94411.1 indolepyruvate oxidoreductase subunit beta [Paludibacteraceae bacterium]
MKIDIILSGVGGQGILSIAAVIGQAALENKHYMKQPEVHGMSQRGGDVQANLRISDKPIFSDLIPLQQADLILSLEPMEALRYMPYVKETGWIVTNETPFKNISNYPNEGDIEDEIKKHKNHILINIDEIAKKVGSARTANMVLLGAALPFLSLPEEDIEDAISAIFEKKGEEIIKLNIKALRAGAEISRNILNK